MSRKLLFLGVVALAVAFGAGGYFLGQQLESPEEARAVAEAPEPSLIAVPVEAVALSNDVVVRGDAEFEGAIDLELDTQLGDGTSRVVTGRVPEIDTLVDEGDILIEVSGRPVFVLQGELPAFREFKPGLEGDDVLQLEDALARLGFLDVPPDRLYGEATEQAIEAMYAAVGYEPRAEDTSQEAQLESARDRVENARKGLADANDALAEAQEPPSQSERVQERQSRQALLDAIDAADEAYDEARDDRPSNALLNAIEDERALDDFPEGVTDRQRSAAAQAIQAAQQAEVDRVEATKEALDNARQALADFDERQAAADADGSDVSRFQDAVGDAQETVDEAAADLAELEEDIGVRLPMAEVVFLPELPRTITEVDVERGDLVTGPVMRISGTEVRVVVGVSEANRPLLELGQKVIIDNEPLGLGPYEGEIIELADRTGTQGQPDTRYHMVVSPQGDYSVTEVVGINFRIQIPIERTEGEVLAVPLAALSAGADGSSRVELLLNDDDETELVQVEVGLSDKNRSLVEITSLGRDLAAGDLVVIGLEQPQVATTDGSDNTDDGGSDGGEDEGGS